MVFLLLGGFIKIKLCLLVVVIFKVWWVWFCFLIFFKFKFVNFCLVKMLVVFIFIGEKFVGLFKKFVILKILLNL